MGAIVTNFYSLRPTPIRPTLGTLVIISGFFLCSLNGYFPEHHPMSASQTGTGGTISLGVQACGRRTVNTLGDRSADTNPGKRFHGMLQKDCFYNYAALDAIVTTLCAFLYPTAVCPTLDAILIIMTFCILPYFCVQKSKCISACQSWKPKRLNQIHKTIFPMITTFSNGIRTPDPPSIIEK